MKELPLSKAYQLIEPGPVILLATSHKGQPNVMTMSWHMIIEFTPPRIACIVSSDDFSFIALCAAKECVIAIPSVDVAEKAVKVGNCSGRDTDKFATFGLTPLPAKQVSPLLIAECFANFECRVVDTRMVNRHNLFVLEAVKAWIHPDQVDPNTIHHRGYGAFSVDGEVIHFKSGMP